LEVSFFFDLHVFKGQVLWSQPVNHRTAAKSLRKTIYRMQEVVFKLFIKPLNFNEMKKIKVLFLSMILLFSMYSTGNACYSGGEVSSECTYTYAWAFGLISETHSVKCNAGSYACCTHDSAKCIKNRSKTSR
jgi:hypothetical protein